MDLSDECMSALPLILTCDLPTICIWHIETLQLVMFIQMEILDLLTGLFSRF